jgi:hypothetical protein
MNFANLIQLLEHAPRPTTAQGGDDFESRLELIDLYVQEDLDRLEQTWSAQERHFLAKLRSGEVRPPSGMDAATFFAIWAFLGGVLLALAAAMSVFGVALMGPAALFGAAALGVGIVLGISRWKQAADYERFMKAYEAYRDMLLADYKRIVAERIARESRRPTG